jgi:hypothetical protein
MLRAIGFATAATALEKCLYVVGMFFFLSNGHNRLRFGTLRSGP